MPLKCQQKKLIQTVGSVNDVFLVEQFHEGPWKGPSMIGYCRKGFLRPQGGRIIKKNNGKNLSDTLRGRLSMGPFLLT